MELLIFITNYYNLLLLKIGVELKAIELTIRFYGISIINVQFKLLIVTRFLNQPNLRMIPK